MLLKTPLKENDTVSMKLLSGEELIATFKQDTGKTVRVTKPVQLVQGPDQNMQFAPYMFTTADEEFDINSDLIVTMAHTSPGLSKQFTEATSNIQIVN